MMNLKKWGIHLLVALTIGPLQPLQAQTSEKPPVNWQNLDLVRDGVMGISTEKAYEQLLKGRTGVPVIVAVIDSGVDIKHEDLEENIWINTEESIANGVDTDGNGYPDDRYGWNFIGNPEGEHVQYDNLEVTRLIRELEPKYISVLPSTPMSAEERREFERYQKMVTDYAEKLRQAQFGQVSYRSLKAATDIIIKKMGNENPSLSDFKAYQPADDTEKMAVRVIRSQLKEEPDFGSFYTELEEAIEYFDNQIAYHLNKNFDSRPLVGDDYENSSERYYGNADVIGPDAEHGTHVAGIIAANRDNDLGIRGVANNARIMTLRTVPDGDERDKDVANSILYAVENGAKVINMSFGKGYVKDKSIVDKAVRIAMENDVLLIHAAGNDGIDLDTNPNFPNRFYADSLGLTKGAAEAWITVGATQWKNDADLVATFSNYGQKTVDVFAPGVKINSTTPGSEYKELDGTSMAAPVVSGLAALIRSYFPELSAVEVKEIIMQSVTRIDHRVRVRDSEGRRRRVPMDQICISGGVVNAFRAIELAQQTVSQRTATQPKEVQTTE